MNSAKKLEQIIVRLEQLSKINLIGLWRQNLDQNLIPVGAKDSLLFEKNNRPNCSKNLTKIHINQTWEVPKYFFNLSTTGATIRLKLTWWASLIEIFINGIKIQEGDLFDQKCRLLLTDNAQEYESFLIEIKLISPKHDQGALQKSELIIHYKAFDLYKFSEELGVIAAYLPLLTEYEFDLEKLISQLELICAKKINDEAINELVFVRKSLINLLSKYFQARKIHILGNAHIDVAWLWAIPETKEVLKRTFNSILDLQTDYLELVFNQTTALFYEWIEQEDATLFAKIKNSINLGKWELLGGMWVEPDCNLPSGESLIRQIIYGKKYFLEKFNQDVKIAFLPDTFGFNFQLPQILLKTGFKAFVTQKLTWNDTNKFPYQIFWWQGLDGSKIFTYFCNELGLGIEPVAIANYAFLSEQKHNIKESLWLYGVGDHGGGPTVDMLKIGQELSKSELFFELIPNSFNNFISNLMESNPDIPTWNDELYLEFHRGTYTTKADQKLKCRQVEILLGNVEKYLAIACITQHFTNQVLTPTKTYPKYLLDQAWKGLLLNQFHDILPGTSIPEVFFDADQTWNEVYNICHQLISIPKTVNVSENLFIWNFCNWSRNEIVEIKLEIKTDFGNQNYNIQQSDSSNLLPIQRTKDRLLFWPNPLNGLSSSWFKLVANDELLPNKLLAADLKITDSIIENKFLKVELNSNSGEISQIFDKRFNNLLLSQDCELQFFADAGQYWDAWNINPNFEKQKLSGLKLESISVYEDGNLRVSWQIVRKFQNSTFIQEIQIDAFNPCITIKNWVDWQEDHILVKAAIPVSFNSVFATYNIQMGVIKRSTNDPTKFEVPAQFWADISSDGIGLSLLNNCKYGYDAKPCQLRLSLLRSPAFPCPDSDRGIHEFVYRIVPHQGNWKQAKIMQLGYELNNPLLVQKDSFESESFISNLSDNVILSAFKQSENGENWIARFYESAGEMVNESISFAASIRVVNECDLLENIISEIPHNQNQFSCVFMPFEIKTFAITFI